MATALKENCNNLHEHIAKINSLEQRLLNALTGANLLFVRNGGSITLPGLISLSFADSDGEAILHRMDLSGICISTGSACNSESTEISHVLKAINLDERLARGTIRISIGNNNSETDIDAIVNAMIKILR